MSFVFADKIIIRSIATRARDSKSQFASPICEIRPLVERQVGRVSIFSDKNSAAILTVPSTLWRDLRSAAIDAGKRSPIMAGR